VIQTIARILTIFRVRSFDTSTEGGRSNERYRRAAWTAMSAGMARAIALLASFISVPLTFSYLGTEKYGLWMVLLSIIAAMGFADLGIGNGLVNAISEAYGKDNRPLVREYLTSALVLLFFVAMALASAGAIAFPFVPWMRVFNVRSSQVVFEGAHAFLILFAWFVINIPLGVVARVQAGLQRGYFPQIINSAGSIVTLFGLLVVIHLHGSLAWLVFATTFGPLAASVLNGYILFALNPWLRPVWHAFRAESARRIFNLGLMFFVLQCGFAVGFTSDNIVISQVLGAAAVASYAVPQKLFSIVGLVITMAVSPLWPAYSEAISRGDVIWVRRTFFRSLWITLGAAVPACALLIVIGPWVLKTFFGKTLQASLTLLIVLGVWGVVNSLSIAVSMLLNGAGVLVPQAATTVVASLVNLAASIVLTRDIGVSGVCLGSIIGQIGITLPMCLILINALFKRLDQQARIRDGVKAGTAW